MSLQALLPLNERVDPVALTVLGRVSVRVDGVEQSIRGRRERAVLCVLVSQRGDVVSTDRLVDEVWGTAAAQSSRGSLQVAVSRLRTLLEPDRPQGGASLLVSRGSGYCLEVPPESVDSCRFTSLVGRAHERLAAGAVEDVLGLCDEAAALWGGAPYAGLVVGDLLAADSRRLEELRMALVELRAEAMLAVGRHALVPGELEAFVAANPFRERAWQLLATGLYRAGRQGDALAAVRRAREVLVEELGVDPSPELQRLEVALLDQSPSLDRPGPAPVLALRTPPPRVAPSAPRGSPPRAGGRGMVGRERAFDVLSEQVQALGDGSGGTVVVTGEAGIGKTRLVTALADLASAAGAQVLWGRCHEADVSPAYWPWVPVVRELAGAAPAPEVAALLSPEAVSAGADPHSAALRTYDAVAALLREAASERPVVVVLEDLHWADTASLQLLAYAADAAAGCRLLLVSTVRVPEVAPPALQGCLAALARAGASRMHLDGLAANEVGTLVSALADRAVDADLAEVVAQRTDGNPFFVIELVRLLEAEQRLSPDGARDVAVPHGVEDVLRLRLARLSDAVGAVLAVASVCGREFDLDLASTVAELDRETAMELLDEAVEARVVEEAERAGRYRFTHALVRETLYTGLSRTRRGRLHARCGEALEGRLEGQPDLVAEVAHHLALGAPLRPELVPAAIRHSVDAARLAEGRGALDRSRTHWEQALSAHELSRDPSPELRFEVLLGLGRARYRQGEIAGSREALDGAVELASQLDDVERVALAATSFRGAGVWHWREFGTSDPAMMNVLRDCLSKLPAGPLRARVLASLGMELMYEWRSLEADPYCAQALAAARELGDPTLFADVAALRELQLFGRPGAPAERLRLAEELLRLPISAEQELYTRFGAAAASLQAGATDEADVQMGHCVELARRLRHTGADVPIAWWLFYRAIAREDPAADDLLAGALDRHRRSSVVAIADMEPMALQRLAGEGAPVPPSAIELARNHANPAYRAFVGQAMAEAGDPDGAVAVLGDPVPVGAWDYASTYGQCMRVDVLAHAGMQDELVTELRRIEPWQHEFAVYGSTDCVGSVAYFVGRGREGLGDREGAAEAYASAIEANRRGGVLPWLRRAEQRLADLRDG